MGSIRAGPSFRSSLGWSAPPIAVAWGSENLQSLGPPAAGDAAVWALIAAPLLAVPLLAITWGCLKRRQWILCSPLLGLVFW